MILTILLGIFISLIANSIQDKIQTQRYLELLQLQINTNLINLTVEINSDAINLHVLHVPLSDSAYKSGLESGHLLNVKLDTLAKIQRFYTFALPAINKLSDHTVNLINDYELRWQHCIIENALKQNNSSKPICENEEKLMNITKQELSKSLKLDLKLAEQSLKEIKKEFNPTRDRLSSPLLHLLMGNEKLAIQE